IRLASSSGGTPIVKERRPSPFRPAISWLAGLVEAIHRGGCGFWSGFGSTRRGGTWKCVPSQENTSVVHAPTITSSASSHMPRVSRGGNRDFVEQAEVQTSVRLHGRAARDKENRMGRLDGKVAIVTGGASGIGAATVRRFVAEGARVVIADLNDEAGEGVAHALGPAAAYRHADVGSLADLEAAVAFARERFGGLDVMHNNAAMSGGGYVAEIEPEVWEQSLRVMLTGVFYGMRAAIPALLARGGGSIISTSSVEGFFGEMLAAPYCTSKAGIINLTRTVALEYGRKNIRANCICPGAVDTPMLGLLAQVSPRSREDLAAQHALGRILRPEEIANVALFLASDESSAITGAAIVADGGLTCGLGITGLPPYGET